MRNEPKTDLRIKRTHKLLREALMQLIEEKGFEALTVQDITYRAMVNRATFYRHYQDKQDLLERCMDDVFQELIASIQPPLRENQEINYEAPFHNIRLLFDHVAEHADFYRVMLRKSGAFTERVRQYIEGVAQERLKALGNRAVLSIPHPIITRYFSSALIGVVAWWLENGQPYPSQEMVDYVLALTLNGSLQAMGLS